MQHWNFSTQIYAGIDSLKRLERFRQERILIVCDPFLTNVEAFQDMAAMLASSNVVEIYTEVRPDPPVADVAKGMEFLQATKPTLIIAIGGGSAIDLTKAIRYFSMQAGICGNIPFVAIPTTSGTGSEVTSFAVITDEINAVKYPIFDATLLPTEALLTPVFVLNSPPSVTAFSGLDVLAHALESLVSTKADSFSVALSEKAISLGMGALVQCVEAGNRQDVRMRMHEASCIAGLAFNRAGLGMMHAIAHQLGAQFHVPHGLANAMVMTAVIQMNAARCEKAKHSYAQIVVRMGVAPMGASDEDLVGILIGALKGLQQEINCPINMTEFGVPAHKTMAKMDVLVQNAMLDATLTTNPFQPTKDDIKQIIHSIL